MASEAFDFGLLVGFVVVSFLTAIVSKAGDVLYSKGIAKPFYVLNHRLHHREILLAMIPTGYVTVAVLVYFSYMHVLWANFWYSAEVTIFLVVLCLAVDMTLDFVSSKEKRASLLHHEWVYLLLPAYVFTHLVAFA